jgi:hypothetical protein
MALIEVTLDGRWDGGRTRRQAVITIRVLEPYEVDSISK